MKTDPSNPCLNRNVHYDFDFYVGKSLQEWAKAFDQVMPKDIDGLFSASTSGAAIASALLMLRPNLSHLHIHPENRVSHRGEEKITSGVPPVTKKSIEHPVRIAKKQRIKMAIVDDFVDTGMTVRGIIGYMKENGNLKSLSCMVFCHKNMEAEAVEIAEEFDIEIYFANGETSFDDA